MTDDQGRRRGSLNGHADTVEVDGVPFERVGVLVWARPAYANEGGDAVVWECGRCGAQVARPALHASVHERTSR